MGFSLLALLSLLSLLSLKALSNFLEGEDVIDFSADKVRTFFNNEALVIRAVLFPSFSIGGGLTCGPPDLRTMFMEVMERVTM